MLITLRFLLLYHKLQLCFKHHLHCITFTCHKRIHEHQLNPKFQFFWKIIKLYIPYILSAFYVYNSPLLLQKKSTSMSLYIMKIKGPFVKLVNVWQNILSTLKVLCWNQNSKSKDPMVQFRFFNIHINHKTQLAMINMPLEGHHIDIYIKKIQSLNTIWHGFWLLVSRFYPRSFISN